MTKIELSFAISGRSTKCFCEQQSTQFKPLKMLINATFFNMFHIINLYYQATSLPPIG